MCAIAISVYLYVCLYMCMSVRSRILKTASKLREIFRYMLPVAIVRSFSGGNNVLHYVSGIVAHIMF